MTGKNKTPKLRFPEYIDEWEQRKLGDIALFSKGSGYSKGDLKEDGTPIILYGRLYTKYETVISEVDTFVDEKKGSVYSKGGEVIVPASGETAEDISIASVVEKAGVLLGGDLNIISPPDDLDSAFLAISISNGKPHNDMAKMAQGKSVVHLHNSDLEKIELPYPSYDEQRRISEFFSDIDNLITLHQRKCDAIKVHKRSMLQKMFPKAGEKAPEIRFPGFADDWEQRKLGDEFERVNERNNGQFGITHWISVAKMYYQEPDKVQSNNLDTRTYVMRKGDIAFEGHPNSEFQFGRFVANDIGDGIISELFPIYRHKLPYENTYWKYAIQLERVMRPIYAKAITSSGASSNKLNEEHFLRESILVPQLDEQRAIGAFFISIDNLISLHQRKCDKYKELKKGLLQKMFV